MRICPSNKFIEIFAQRFHYLEEPFYKFFALNLLFLDTSYSLVLKYSSFSVLHFIIIISSSKSIKFAQKFCICLKFLTLEGTLGYTSYHLDISVLTISQTLNCCKCTIVCRPITIIIHFLVLQHSSTLLLFPDGKSDQKRLTVRPQLLTIPPTRFTASLFNCSSLLAFSHHAFNHKIV